MIDRHEQLVAYLATLATLVTVFATSLFFAWLAPSIIGKIEAFGLGTITGGLIGVLRIPQPRTGPNVGPNENVSVETQP